jgi:uncharacterized protein YkwD
MIVIFLIKNKNKVFVATLIFLSVTLSFNVANASTLNANFSSIFSFINKNVVDKIKKDFCKNYILSISSGEWKEGEFRTNLGKKTCTSYSVPSDITGQLATTTLQPLNGSTSITQKENSNKPSVNNPTPDVYAPKLITSGEDLNIRQIISLTNTERKNNDSNLVNLNENSVLKNIAAIRVKDMFTLQYFEHNSPKGDNASKEAIENNYNYITIGENIALGNFDGSKGLVTAWMNSPGHRANILNKNYTEIGVYEMQGTYKGQSVWIAAQIFGKPIKGCISPSDVLKDKIAKYKVSADSMMSNIKNIDEELKTSISDNQIYNSKVAERNTLAGLYNSLASEIKISVVEFNSQVSAYNVCIKTL